ncbi:MAG: hypothetical protein ACKOZW_12630, partial [Cyanobium sp.]
PADGSRRGSPALSGLVCSRCSTPIEPRRLDPAGRRARLANVATLLALVLAGGVLFTLSTLHDAQLPAPEAAEEAGGEASGSE